MHQCLGVVGQKLKVECTSLQ